MGMVIFLLSTGEEKDLEVVKRWMKGAKIDTHEHKVSALAQSMMDMIDIPRNEDFEVWAKQHLDNPDWRVGMNSC